jgi:hypothetical protein
VPQAAQRDLRVAGGGGRERRPEIDLEAALRLDGEAGLGQPGAPVLVHVHAVLGPLRGGHGLAAILQRGGGRGGEEGGERAELDDREQTARLERAERLADGVGRVGQVVHRSGRPHQVGRAEAGPGLVEVGRHGADPIGHPGLLGAFPQVGEHLLVQVDGGDLGLRQVLGQRQGAGAAARAEVDDLRPARCERTDPGDQVAVVVVQDFGVEVEHLGEV